MMSGESLFEIVNKSLKQKLEFYKILDEDGAIGTLLDTLKDHDGKPIKFYTRNTDGKMVPAEFLQGGLNVHCIQQ